MKIVRLNKKQFVIIGILSFFILLIATYFIKINSIINSRNTVIDVSFNSFGLVCNTNQGVLYSDSDGVKSVNEGKKLEGINSRSLLIESDLTVYAYEIQSGMLFYLDHEKKFNALYQIDTGIDEIYANDNKLFTVKCHDDESRLELTIFDLTNGDRINLSNLRFKSYVSTDESDFKLNMYFINDFVLMLDDANTTHFFELYDKEKGTPIYAKSLNSFFVYKYSEDELIATNTPFKKSEDVCKFKLCNGAIQFDNVLRENSSNYYSRYFICYNDYVTVIGYFADSFKKNYYSNRQGDFKHNSISNYDLTDFSLNYSALLDERIVAYDEEYYYTYSNKAIKKYSLIDRREVSRQSLSNLKEGNNYLFQKCNKYLFVYDEISGEVLEILVLD